MVSNQHRDQDRRADAAFLAEAIAHLRGQGQLACGGWSSASSDDGRHVIASGSEVFRQEIIETRGPYAESILAYLLTMDPWRVHTLFALLEELQRDISTGAATGSTRRAAVRYAEDILGRKRTATQERTKDADGR